MVSDGAVCPATELVRLLGVAESGEAVLYELSYFMFFFSNFAPDRPRPESG